MNRITWTFLLGGVLLSIVLLSASPQEVVRAGNTVAINYTIMLEDGRIYDSTRGREPLNVTLGQGTLLPAFEAQVIGMRAGDSKTFTLTPDQAYGAYRPDLVGTLNRSQLEQGVEPEIGKQVKTEFRDGTPALAVITSFTDTNVTLDANHPLAGETLTFAVQLLKIDSSSSSASFSQATLNWPVILIVGMGIGLAGFFYFSMRKRQLSMIAARRTPSRMKRH